MSGSDVWGTVMGVGERVTGSTVAAPGGGWRRTRIHGPSHVVESVGFRRG